MSFRVEKVASEIKKMLAQPIAEIARGLNAGLVTLTSVRVSKDLQQAKVYISIFNKKSSPGLLIDELERRKGELRHLIGKDLRLRFTPDLKFFLDDTLEQMEKIQTLIDSVKPLSLDESPENKSGEEISL
jgi:ribosome-binding factor A